MVQKSPTQCPQGGTFSFQGAKGTSMMQEYSVPPFAVTNKSEFFRWLQSFFAQYLVETRSVEELAQRRAICVDTKRQMALFDGHRARGAQMPESTNKKAAFRGQTIGRS